MSQHVAIAPDRTAEADEGTRFAGSTNRLVSPKSLIYLWGTRECGRKDDMNVLVTAASKHGATAEVAERIGEALGSRGLDVTVAAPKEIETVAGYDAVVLGSGVYAGHWLKEAKGLVARIADVHPSPMVWLFSSGPLGDPLKPDEDPVDVAEIAEAISSRDHRVFAGKIDKGTLSFGERAIMRAVRAPDGDFRDWDAITDWAESIADALEE